MNGLILLVASLLLVLAWFGQVGLGVVFSAGVVLTVIVAALVGVTVPLLLDRLGIDPAVASSVLVMTVTDMFGFFAFLGLAALYLL